MRLDQTREEVLNLRLVGCGRRRWCGGGLYDQAEFVRLVRHGQGAFALMRLREASCGRPLPAHFRRADPGQILDHPVGPERGEVGQFRAARGDGEHAGVDGAAAFDVQRRVADDEDFVVAQRLAEVPVTALTRDAGEVVAMVVIVAERSCLGFKPGPQRVMPQLDFRAEPDVTREETEPRRSWQRGELREKFVRAGARATALFAEQMIEPESVAIEEAARVLGSVRDAVMREQFADQSGVRAPGEGEMLGAIGNLELHRERAPERAHAGPAGLNQRAIDVEQDEFDHARTLARDGLGDTGKAGNTESRE